MGDRYTAFSMLIASRYVTVPFAANFPKTFRKLVYWVLSTELVYSVFLSCSFFYLYFRLIKSRNSRYNKHQEDQLSHSILPMTSLQNLAKCLKRVWRTCKILNNSTKASLKSRSILRTSWWTTLQCLPRAPRIPQNKFVTKIILNHRRFAPEMTKSDVHLSSSLLAVRVLKLVGDHLSMHFEETKEKAEWLPDLASRLQKLANDANPIISKKAFAVGMFLHLTY